MFSEIYKHNKLPGVFLNINLRQNYSQINNKK
jgi:hypothetical protein